jgi:nicotinamidase-related amidase
MSFYESHLKEFQNILKELGVTSRTIELDKAKQYCFDIYVIDMQNGFMPSGECGVLGADDLPAKISNYLDYMINIVEELNKNGHNVKIRFAFSRDYHHPDHQSFQSHEHPTGFPAHCQYGTFSSMIHHHLSDWINNNKDKHDIQIIFKAFHPSIESFSALPYTSHYDASQRQGTCNGSFKVEKENGNSLICGGGVYFSEMSLENCLLPNPFNQTRDEDMKLVNNSTKKETINANAKITLKILSAAKPFKQSYFLDTIHYSFITGLAGDFCVRDTLINTINQRVLDGKYGDSCLLYNLTAYVTLPLGDKTMPDIMDATGQTVTKPVDGIKYYIWVTSIREMILDYIIPSRGVCMKPPIFMTHQEVSKNLPKLIK